MSADLVRYSVVDHIASIMLDRPPVNALSAEGALDCENQPLWIDFLVDEKLQELLDGRSSFRMHLNGAAGRQAGRRGCFE